MTTSNHKPFLIYYEILNYQKENIEKLHKYFNVLTLPNPEHDSVRYLKKAQVIIEPLGYYFGEEKIDLSPELKIIASNTTGYPHIDVGYATKKGIKVITLKGQSEFLDTITPTAELAWGLIIALTRNLVPAIDSVKKGFWDRRPFGGRRMLSKMNLGIAGFGRLGSKVGNYAQSFCMNVKYYDPFVSKSPIGIEKVETLEELVSVSDIITIHIPHEPETEKLFGKSIFSHFKPEAFLINTSRGELVDQEVLLNYLTSGKLAGAALDVFDGEFIPGFIDEMKKQALWKYAKSHQNLLITPHIGGSTWDAWKLTEEYTIDMIINSLIV